jgi:hypothetical protein
MLRAGVDVDEFLPPAPRTVRRKFGSGCGLWFMRLFVLPHTFAGIFLLGIVPAGWYFDHFARPVTATVDRREMEHTKKGGTLFHLYYHYDFGGRRYDGSDLISEARYVRARDGEPFEGRAVAVLFGRPWFRGPTEAKANSPQFLVVAFALAWNGLLSVFLYGLWIVPLRQRRLVKHGQVATGVITSRRITRGRGTNYTLMYAFPAVDGSAYSGECGVNRADYERTPDGTNLLIIYNPARPRRNLAYRFSDFIAGPSGNAWS